jgi:hypothetical protein
MWMGNETLCNSFIPREGARPRDAMTARERVQLEAGEQ